MIALLVAGLVALWASSYVWHFAYNSYKLRNFPGPLAFPLVGNLYTAESFQVLRYVQKLKKEYGAWFVFWGLSKPMIVCTDPAGVREILSDIRSFVKGPDYTYYFAIPFGQGLVTSVGEKHKADRRLLAQYFHGEAVANYVNVMNEHVHRAMATLIGQNVQDASIDCEQFFARLTLRTFGEFCLHHDFSTNPELEHKICKSVSKGSYNIGFSITTGVPMWHWTPWYRAVMSTRRIIEEACQPIVQERRRAIENHDEYPNDPLTAMLRDNLSDKDLADHLMTLVCAGHDTTAFFCSYTTMLLAQNPREQEKLRAEIQSVVGERRDIDEDDIDQMMYLRKVMQESLRIYPVIPAVSRTTLRDVKIVDSKQQDIIIPEGVDVLMPIIAMHRSSELWTEPSRFNPDRWEDTPTFRNDPRIGYLPFGYGSRICFGKNLALMESAIFLCNLLLNYRLSTEPGFKPHILAGISLTTSNGVRVRVSSL